MVEDRPTFIESKEVFQAVVDGYIGGYLLAHNHFYDMRVLGNHGIDTSKHTWICTWRMAKKIFNNMPEIESTSLPYLRFALDLDVPLELHCHRAGHDSYITGKLLEVLVDMMEELEIIDVTQPYGPQIVAWAEAPIIYDRMMFGKHKGELMSEIPKSYWLWATKNMDSLDEEADNFDPDFAASVHRALGIE
jgi:exodeoxyribonuclease X